MEERLGLNLRTSSSQLFAHSMRSVWLPQQELGWNKSYLLSRQSLHKICLLTLSCFCPEKRMDSLGYCFHAKLDWFSLSGTCNTSLAEVFWGYSTPPDSFGVNDPVKTCGTGAPERIKNNNKSSEEEDTMSVRLQHNAERKKFPPETAHNKVCGLSWVTRLWFIGRGKVGIFDFGVNFNFLHCCSSQVQSIDHRCLSSAPESILKRHGESAEV